MKRPRLAVVIPCYNYGEFLQEAVGSVVNANRKDVELVIVDDGSTDKHTQTEVERLVAEGFHVIRQQNKGLAAARDAGIRATTADYILPLDADNKIRADYIDRAITLLDSDPKVGVVYGDAEYFGSKTGRWKMGEFDLDRLLEWNYIDACSALRRKVWEENGGYDGTMPRMGLEDWDMWLGAASRGWEFTYVPEVLFDYRVSPGSMIARANPNSHETERFIARKHGLLYRKAWQQLKRERWLENAKILGRDLHRRLKNTLGRTP
jgi:glycosyltransferase involved in cell wall biosynthesis